MYRGTKPLQLEKGIVTTEGKQYMYDRPDSNGNATKEVYTKALKAYQEYLAEIKSVQRDKAAAADESYQYY